MVSMKFQHDGEVVTRIAPPRTQAYGFAQGERPRRVPQGVQGDAKSAPGPCTGGVDPQRSLQHIPRSREIALLVAEFT